MGKKTDTQTVKSAPWGPSQGYWMDLMSRARGLLDTGMDPWQLQGQRTLLDYSTSPELAGLIGGTRQAFDYALNQGLSPDANPYLAQHAAAAARPVTQSLTESILPNIRGGATGAGQYGSTRQGIAEGLAAGRTQQAISDMTGRLYSTAYGQGLQNLQAMTALAPQIANLGLLPGTIQSTIGQERTQFPYWQHAQMANILGAVPGGEQERPYTYSPLGSALGFGLGGLGLLYGMGLLGGGGAGPHGGMDFRY